MPRYRVNHRYSAVDNGVLIGPFVAGSAVELGADRAEWVNRDSPGTLVPVDEEGQGDEVLVDEPVKTLRRSRRPS